MSKSRIKKALVFLTTRTEAEATVTTVAALTNKKRILTAQMDKRLLEIKADYESEISALEKAAGQ